MTKHKYDARSTKWLKEAEALRLRVNGELRLSKDGRMAIIRVGLRSMHFEKAYTSREFDTDVDELADRFIFEANQAFGDIDTKRPLH